MSLFVIIVKNLKRRKQIEILLRKSNERFFKIFNHSPVSMAITSTSDGVFLYVNDAFCQLTGYERENIIGRKSVDVNIISHDGRAKSVENIKKNGGKVKDVELKINRVNGEVIDILFSADTLEIDNEMCFVYASIDISERKKAEEKLREANKELDSFSYSVSHDLRTPLRAISGYTKILIEDYSDKMDSEGRRIMDVIVNNARKMGQLIDDLLAFSRLGKQNLVKVDIDMSFLVHSIADVFMDQSLNKEIEIDIKKLDSVMGDSSMIKIVVDNLLANALKYSSKKEKIKIEVGSYQEGKTTVYYIKDNGVGFDMLYYDKLFGVFQRLHSTSEFEGTGVGLAIVQRIVGRHGGKVWAVAKVDEGATFYFSLPIV
jgi:PAS domain S-box-containing protein